MPIDLSKGDFEDPFGFFLRSEGGATVTYIPLNNVEGEDINITKTMPASEKFDDPVVVKKVFAVGSPVPDDLYAGYGV